jgi:hypothetical protein
MNINKRKQILFSIEASTSPLYKVAISKEEIFGYITSVGDKGVVNLLAPSVIGSIVNKVLGGRFIGFGLDLILRMLGIDFGEMLNELCSSVKSLVQSKGDKTSPSDVQSAVDRVIDTKFGGKSSEASSNDLNKELRVIKLAYVHIYQSLYKEAKLASPIAQKAAGPTSSFLKKLFGTIFGLSLRAAGMQLFADVASHMIGMPSTFDIVKEKFHPVVKTIQTKFKPKSSFNNARLNPEEEIFISNNKESIKALLKDWANEAYSNIDQDALNYSKELDKLASLIAQHNYYVAPTYIYMPESFHNKKEVVDFFIDDVAGISK